MIPEKRSEYEARVIEAAKQGEFLTVEFLVDLDEGKFDEIPEVSYIEALGYRR